MTYQFTEPGHKVVEKLFAVSDYSPAFWVAGIACVVAAAIVLMVRHPHHKA
jgi:hypothetical protein